MRFTASLHQINLSKIKNVIKVWRIFTPRFTSLQPVAFCTCHSAPYRCDYSHPRGIDGCENKVATAARTLLLHRPTQMRGFFLPALTAAFFTAPCITTAQYIAPQTNRLPGSGAIYRATWPAADGHPAAPASISDAEILIALTKPLRFAHRDRSSTSPIMRPVMIYC